MAREDVPPSEGPKAGMEGDGTIDVTSFLDGERVAEAALGREPLCRDCTGAVAENDIARSCLDSPSVKCICDVGVLSDGRPAAIIAGKSCSVDHPCVVMLLVQRGVDSSPIPIWPALSYVLAGDLAGVCSVVVEASRRRSGVCGGR